MALINAVTITPGLKAAIEIINTLDSQKFPLVLNRVCQCIQNRSDNLKPFSEEEEEKLTGTLSLSPADLKLMLDCSTLILKQAAFNIIKPPVFRQQLSEHWHLEDDKVEAFVSAWTTHAKNIVGALKLNSTHPNQVEGVSWMLNAAVSSSDSSRLMEPRAIIELKLKPTETSRSNVTLDLDQVQLQALYDTLETIQTRLDNLR